MALDEDIKQYLESVGPAARPSEQVVSVAEMRAVTDSAWMSKPPSVRQARTRDFTVPGREGPIPVRHYLPEAAGAESLVLYAHGGGFVFGNLDTHHEVTNRLCLEGGAQVLAIDYRLAPEHPFPAGVNDTIDVMTWSAANLVGAGTDARRMFIAGDSAGANFAAVAAQVARDEGIDLAGQILIYPATDFRDTHYDSRISRASGFGMTQADMLWYRSHYLSDDRHESDPLASPLANDDLSRLAPAFLMTAGYDPLHSEGEEYARRLEESGVDVEYLHLPGANHGVFSNFDLFRSGEATWQAMLTWLGART